MFMLSTNIPLQPVAQTVYDNGGRPIGQVIEPRTDRVIGRGEGTVLLKRER